MPTLKHATIAAVNAAVMAVILNHPEAGVPNYRGKPIRMACQTRAGSTGEVLGFDGQRAVIRPDVAPFAQWFMAADEVTLAAVTSRMVPSEIVWSGDVGAAIWHEVLAMLSGAGVDVTAPL